MKQKLIIVGLIIILAFVSISHMNLNIEHELLQLHYGYAMDMSKMNLEHPDIVDEMIKKVFETKKQNILT